MDGEEPLRAEERAQRPRRREHLREPLEGSAAGLRDRLTPRNSGGTCTWCVVENVTLQRNIVRNVAAGINILGYDNTGPSGQASNLIFRQNLFYDVKTSLGGNGWFMIIGDEPRDITIEHNTFDSDGTTVVNVYGGTSTDPREVLRILRCRTTRRGTDRME